MSTEKRLIDMDDTMNKLRAYAERKHEAEHYELANGILKAVNYIRNNIVRVDAVEVVHGRWRYYSTTMQECSNCQRHTARHKFKYCPHCGAIMEDKYHE